MGESGINQYGQVVFANSQTAAGNAIILPPEDWGPFSTPYDLLIGQEVTNQQNAAKARTNFWKGLAIFMASIALILGFIFLVNKTMKQKTN